MEESVVVVVGIVAVLHITNNTSHTHLLISQSVCLSIIGSTDNTVVQSPRLSTQLNSWKWWLSSASIMHYFYRFCCILLRVKWRKWFPVYYCTVSHFFLYPIHLLFSDFFSPVWHLSLSIPHTFQANPCYISKCSLSSLVLQLLTGFIGFQYSPSLTCISVGVDEGNGWWREVALEHRLYEVVK